MGHKETGLWRVHNLLWFVSEKFTKAPFELAKHRWIL